MKVNPAIFALLFLYIGIPSSSVSEGAKICRSTSIPFHTWVQMDYSCAQAGNCGIRTPFTQWNDIGYENGNGGILRDESKNPNGVYRCSSWFVGQLQGSVARSANAQQERTAISALVGAGWNTAQYGLIAGGLTSITCDPTTWSWAPRSGKNNVCWTFTCAYSTYLYRVLGIRPNVIGSELSLKNRPEIPTGWTCKPEQYASGDGCQCNCGVFDPDCDSFEAVSINCPNNDDICIPSPLNEPVCALRHEVLSDRKLIQIQLGVAVHHPQFFFSNDTNIDGAPWGNYSKTYTRDAVPTTWTCNPLFYGSKDGCDCQCGAWTQIVRRPHIPKKCSIVIRIIMKLDVLCLKLLHLHRFVCMTGWLFLLRLMLDILRQIAQRKHYQLQLLSLYLLEQHLALSFL